MKRALSALFVVVLVLVAVRGPGARSSARHAPRDVIVKLRSPAADAAALRASVGATLKRRLPSTGAELWELRSMTVADAVERLERDARVEFVEPNYIVEAHDVFPDDPYFPQQWALHNTGLAGGNADADIDAPGAWSVADGGTVVIGVLDSGVDREHEDLAGSIYTNPGEIPGNGVDDDQNGFTDDVHGWDFVFNDNDPNDAHGHGTHVAGTIAARGNNARGSAGVAWTARILPIRMLDDSALGTVADAVRAIEYATRMGVRLTNNSWGGFTQSYALREAIRAAGEQGMLFVASAGNDGRNSDVYPIYPAAYDLDNILSVGATDRGDSRCFFSNFGAVSVDLVAPGSGIVSTFPDDAYGALSGTSMAAAFVSGAACLLWQRAPLLTHTEVKQAILSSADPLPALAAELAAGGRLNVHAALSGLDPVAPAAVADLVVELTGSSSARLAWTAPGDDAGVGTARRYDLRYSHGAINESNFGAATRVLAAAPPRLAGSSESFEVTGLSFYTTYHFALVVEDEAGNRSLISNLASGTTLGVPGLDMSPTSLLANVHTGGTHAGVLTIANSGDGTLDFAALVFPPWAIVDPPSGRVPAGESREVSVVFDAGRLAGGVYTSTLVFSTNDPVQASVPIPVSLQVSNAPAIHVSSAAVDFGARSGACAFDTLLVSNRGTLTLLVSGVSVTDGPFVVDPLPFLLGPDETRAVPVIFCPNSPGRSVATLTIRSNDPDQAEYAVTLKGRTAEPPVMSAVPPSLAANVPVGGVANRTLTVANDGGSDLDFEIAIVEPDAGLAVDVLGASPPGGDVVAVGRPLSRDELLRLRASHRGELVVGSADGIDRGRPSAPPMRRSRVLERVDGARLEEVFGSTENQFSGDARTRGNLFACTKSTNLREHRFYMDPNESGEIWFLVYEGLGPSGFYELVSASDVSPSGTHAGWYSSGRIQVPLHAGRFYLIAATFEPAVSYYSEDAIAPYPIPASFGELTAAAGWTWNPVTTFPPYPFQVVAPQAFGDPVAYHQTLVTDGVVTWASAGRGSGTVKRGTSVDVEVRLRAAPGFPEGSHAATVRITGNDPVTPEILVPVQFQVTPAADIAFSQAALDYSACFVGAAVKDTLVVSNAGTQTLHVTGIASNLPQFTVNPSSFTLVANQNIEVAVTFTPGGTNPVTGALTISSNDPDEPAVAVALRGRGAEPPAMFVSPLSLAEALVPGATATRTVSITNPGRSALTFIIDTDEGIDAQPGGKPGSPIRPQQATSRDVTPSQPAPRGTHVRRYSGDAPAPFAHTAPAARPAARAGNLDVLVLRGGPVSGLIDLLLEFADVSTVDAFDATVATPTLNTLAGYDAMVLINDQPYADPVALGDVLADFVDQGGGVVMTLASFISDFEVQGRFSEYMPFTVGTGPYDPAQLGRHDATHPIMAGVQSLIGSFLGAAILEPGACWVADWTNGLPLVATRGRRVAAINVLLVDGGYWAGDVPRLVHNAIAWVANPGWLVAEPAEGVVPAHTSIEVALTFHTDELVDGNYFARVRVAGDDPRRPEVVLPVSLVVDSTTATSVQPGPVPSSFALLVNRPNPFNPSTTIAYDLPRTSEVSLVVYDVAGKPVRELVNATRPAGRHSAVWDGRNDASHAVASGVYFYRLTAGDFVQTKKMILLK